MNFKKNLILILLTLSSFSLKASEELFTQTTLKISEYFQSLPSEALVHSKVDVNKLYAFVKFGNFKVQCAKDNDLYYLKVYKKLAFVFPSSIDRVLIDCSEEVKKSWKELYNWENNNNYLYFVHQVLRVMNIESSDDDYSISTTLINTNNFYKNLVNKMSLALYTAPDQAGCGLYNLTTAHGKDYFKIFMEFRYNNKVLSITYFYHEHKDIVAEKVKVYTDQFLNLPEYFDIREKVYKLSKNLCPEI